MWRIANVGDNTSALHPSLPLLHCSPAEAGFVTMRWPCAAVREHYHRGPKRAVSPARTCFARRLRAGVATAPIPGLEPGHPSIPVGADH